MFRSEIQYSLMNFLIRSVRKRELILFRTNFERSDREREIGIYSLESTNIKSALEYSFAVQIGLQHFYLQNTIGRHFH